MIECTSQGLEREQPEADPSDAHQHGRFDDQATVRSVEGNESPACLDHEMFSGERGFARSVERLAT